MNQNINLKHALYCNQIIEHITYLDIIIILIEIQCYLLVYIVLRNGILDAIMIIIIIIIIIIILFTSLMFVYI